MRWLFIGALVLIASVTVATVTLPDPGYVLIGFGNYSMETSLLVFVVLLVLMYLALRLLAGLWGVPVGVRRWGVRRKRQRLQNLYNQAVIELTDGRLETAERRLFRLTSFSDAPLDIFLTAARAANQLNVDERRDASLRRAVQRYPEAEIAVALVEAELQLSRGQLDQARTTLTTLQTLAPHNEQVLRLQMRLLLQLEDWQALREILPELKRRHVLDEEQWQKLAVRIYRKRLREFVDAKDVDALNSDWKKLPRPVQEETDLAAVYIEQLILLGAYDYAEKFTRDQIKKSWNQRLVYLYGDLITGNPAAQQNVAERWAETHPEDPVLLLTLGKISLRNELWGKAQNYFEASIAQHATSEAYRLLGMLLERLDEPERAAECYRKGVELLDQPGLMALSEPLNKEEAGGKLIPISHEA